MSLLHRAPGLSRLPAGILSSRRLADAALLRLFSRSRRRGTPLLLLRLRRQPPQALPLPFLEVLAEEVRIGDLMWHEPGAEVFLLLEDTDSPDAVLARLRQRARQQQVELAAGSAEFPRQGLTLEALLEEVAWRP